MTCFPIYELIHYFVFWGRCLLSPFRILPFIAYVSIFLNLIGYYSPVYSKFSTMLKFLSKTFSQIPYFCLSWYWGWNQSSVYVNQGILLLSSTSPPCLYIFSDHFTIILVDNYSTITSHHINEYYTLFFFNNKTICLKNIY